MTYYIINDNNEVITRYTIHLTADDSIIYHSMNTRFLDGGNKKVLDYYPPNVHNPEDNTPATSMDTRKYAPIIDYDKYPTGIISQGDYSHDNLHHDFPNIYLYDFSGYKSIKEYNGIYHNEIVK